MSVRSRKTRIVALGPCQQMSLGISDRTLAEGSFQAVLSSCASGDVQEAPTIAHEAPKTTSTWTPPETNPLRWQNACSSAMTRAWTFLHARYKISTTKRLRVSETISLGEKRFVAIVVVEGREFLVGGGVAGMSLLAQLGSAAGATSDLGRNFGDAGSLL
jgi:hypothetical protein